MRRPLTLVVLATLAATALTALPAQAASSRKCGSIRLDQDLKRDSHGLYGAFGILRRGTSCRTARRVADRWVHDSKAPSRHPWRYLGWSCHSRATSYQEFAVVCTKPRGRITFKAELPAG